MADTTLTALTGASTLDGTELLYAVQGGADRKATVAQVKTWASNAPTLVTPVLGVATATSVNKVAITAPATSATLTIPDGVTLTGPASSGTAMTLGNAETVTGAKTFGSAGAVGKLKVAGTTSGSTIVDATAVASGTLTLPAATDTLIGKATTDTLTNKTFDTAGSGNSFSINGTTVSAVAGSGAVVLANTPTLITPNIGVATGTSLDVSGVLESGANSGTNGQLKLFGSTSGDVTVKATAAAGTATVFQLPADNGTNGWFIKTNGSGVLSYAAIPGGGDALTTNPLSQFAATTSSQLAGVISDETGSGALVFGTSPTLTTPVLGVASATTINKVALTAPATGSTLTIADGKTLTVSNSITVAGTDSTTMTFPSTSSTIAVAGKQTIFIPANAMFARTTNGAATGSVEQSTNKNMVKSLDFDTTTQEFAQFSVAFPKSWNLSTVTFQPHFSQLTTAAGGVVFGLAGVAVSTTDDLDVAFGTAQTSTTTAGTLNKEYVGPESSAITIAGTPAAGDRVMFQINRTVADGSDTLAQDARLHGIRLFFTTNAATDA